MTQTAKILLWASFLALIPFGLFGPIYAIFVRNIGGDVLDAGIAFGIFSILSSVFIFLLGHWRFLKNI